MDLRELGALLKAERERRGISPNEITEQIKISRSALAAIEEGEEDKLPHKVYAKGFIKNYARLLDLDPEETARTLAAIFSEDEENLSRTAIPEHKASIPSIKASSASRKKSSTLGLALLVLLLLAGAGFWYYSFLSPGAATAPDAPAAQPSDQNATPPAAQSDQTGATRPDMSANTLDTPPSANGSPSQESTAEPETRQDHVPGEQALQEASPNASAPYANESAASGEAAANGQEAAAGTNEQAGLPVANAAGNGEAIILGEGPNLVEIVAKSVCWLEVAADGGSMNEITLQKGQRLTGRFEDVLLARLGNAGGVDIHFNGKPYAFDGISGQVKTLKFTTKKSGQAQEAAQPQAEAAKTPDNEAVQTETSPQDSQTAPPATGEKVLEAYGTDGSWMIVMPDGKGAKEIFVKRGERLRFPFEKSIEVRLGNPSRLMFTYDGKEYPAASERGESKTLRFP